MTAPRSAAPVLRPDPGEAPSWLGRRRKLIVVVAIAAVVVVALILRQRLTSVVGRTGPLTMDNGPCANATDVPFAHAWWHPYDESATPGPGAHSGIFKVVTPNTAVFVDKAEGVTIRFHRMRSSFSSLDCSLR